MTRLGFALAACLLSSTLFAQPASEPILQSTQMPRYPVIARFARVTGEVNAAFTLDSTGNVASVQILAGPSLLWGETRENIQTWKFKMPLHAPDSSQKYETKFSYRFSGHEVDGDDESGPVLRLTVSVDSFHQIEIVTDTYKPTLQH